MWDRVGSDILGCRAEVARFALLCVSGEFVDELIVFSMSV